MNTVPSPVWFLPLMSDRQQVQVISEPGPAGYTPGGRFSPWTAGKRRPGAWWLVLLGSLVRQAAQAAEADRGRAALFTAGQYKLLTPLPDTIAARRGLREA